MTFRYLEWNPKGKHTAVLLHGFTGSDHSFDMVIPYLSEDIRVIVPLLPGHGSVSYPLANFAMDTQVDWLHQCFKQLGLKRFTLIGYSMGGRLALGYSLEYPVEKLLLTSSSPGIEDEQAREERAQADANLATRIVEVGIDAFVDYWEEIPLFASQKKLPTEVQETVRRERESHEAIPLAQSLREFSTGKMPNYWPMLGEYSNSVKLVVGELDQKFVQINKVMQTKFPHASLTIVEQVGHAIHVENPKMFATIIEEYILKEENS
ncbi:2-succinyl-6-hydroxy-2,4-cyclohexadiene-1-carboxylate synthase [Chryseomicrobium palamuruense]|uniref:Putative 2-succinyl-6-hydroxy-2,4-cyclohexadiene-1-carboxylate synthase n=1 Tax=Chryseomicrobium palamuruense TaxID=682973 RepID=A0ABV8UZ81_9BACL